MSSSNESHRSIPPLVFVYVDPILKHFPSRMSVSDGAVQELKSEIARLGEELSTAEDKLAQLAVAQANALDHSPQFRAPPSQTYAVLERIYHTRVDWTSFTAVRKSDLNWWLDGRWGAGPRIPDRVKRIYWRLWRAQRSARRRAEHERCVIL